MNSPPRQNSCHGAACRQWLVDEVGDPAALLQWLGVTPSHSRPRVSNDNAYAESVFRTCKYRPEYPAEGFDTLEEARAWVMRFEIWYNTEHRHSGLNFVTPAQRHDAQAEAIMQQRIEVYEAARARHPLR